MAIYISPFRSNLPKNVFVDIMLGLFIVYYLDKEGKEVGFDLIAYDRGYYRELMCIFNSRGE